MHLHPAYFLGKLIAMEMNLMQEFVLVRSTSQCYHLRTRSTTSSIIVTGYAYCVNGWDEPSQHGIFGDEIDCYGGDLYHNLGVLLGS